MNKKTLLLPQLIVILCFFIYSPSFGADVWLTVGDGTGTPGSSKPVDISLDNAVTVKEVTMYIDGVYNYTDETYNLRVGEYTTTGRVSSTYSFTAYEINPRTYIYFTGQIDPGTGAIFTITYDVYSGAPEGECTDLNPQDITVKDNANNTLDVESESGQFCFKCTSDGECEDDLYCNGEETCNMVSGICEAGSTPCPDDGLYCNGYEVCWEAQDNCVHSCYPDESICDPLLCNDDEDSCYCTNDDQCVEADGGLYCNGEETCDSGICQPGVPPCAEPEPVCDEDTEMCYAKDVTITVGEGGGYPHSIDNPVKVSFENPNDDVIQIKVHIWDEGDYLTCTGCTPVTGRCPNPAACECNAGENGDGSCTVTLSFFYCTPYCSYFPTPSGGEGPIATVYYEVYGKCEVSGAQCHEDDDCIVPGEKCEKIPPGCVDLDLEVEHVLDDAVPDPNELWALPVSGEFCDRCEGDFECDGDVDGRDVGWFKPDVGREDCETETLCNGDFDCDGDTDGRDVGIFKTDVGREDCPICPFSCDYW